MTDLAALFPMPEKSAPPAPSNIDDLRTDLQEIRRRLGPYTALQGSNEPWVLRDAEIARRLTDVITVLDKVITKLASR